MAGDGYSPAGDDCYIQHPEGLSTMNHSANAALESAIAAEIAAADLYSRLSALASEIQTRRLFESLTGDERRHRQLLEARYKAVIGQDPPAQPVRRIRMPVGAVSMLWPAALTLAINAEADARESYLKSAETEVDAEAHSMYRQLAADEATHRRLLEAEYAARLGQPFSDVELDTWVRE